MAEEQRRQLDSIAVETTKTFAYGECAHNDGANIKYRFFTPQTEDGKQYPLVIFLHGGGECGDDNELHVAGNIGAYAYALPENQAKHPCYVLAPQCPKGLAFTAPEFERSFMKLFRGFTAQNAVDKSRVYITGLSLGGMGTWHYISKYPKLFAAAIPICGAGNPYTIKNAKHVPVWACHAADDPVVPIDDTIAPSDFRLSGMVGTRRMVEALRACGGSVRFTEYPAGYIAETYGIPKEYAGHFAWEPAYRDAEMMDWLFAQNRKLHDEYELIKPGVWFFNDYSDASYYMVEGRDKALVIDTGMGAGKIMPLIRRITDKPVELAVTHIHGDHMLHADEFDTVYIPEGDRELLPTFIKAMMPDLKLPEENIRWIKDGHTFDLGGVYVEAISLPGHTPGSMVYADHKHKCLFTGDAIGSGIIVLMSIVGALKLSEYKANLDIFCEKAKEFEDYTWLGGHRYQERGGAFGNYYEALEAQPMGFNPLHRQLALDMSELCQKLLSGELEGTEIPPFNGKDAGEPTLTATYRSAGIVYLKSQVK
ncbi:MAG: MBL fold metallo-hydrolase [Clostridiales bacterium]|nr:MBL fold metallo-hydrolase [Clostridiales bacterium]